MNNLSNLWGREPALVLGLIQAALVLIMAFGLELDTEQVGAIMAFVNILLAVITRSQVVPTYKLDKQGVDY
jgi:hypothetical protein